MSEHHDREAERWPDWLAQARITDDPEGDFIADMRRDRNAPRSFASIEALRGYLRAQGACQGALAAVPTVWRRFQDWKRRHAWPPMRSPMIGAPRQPAAGGRASGAG